MGGLAKLSSSNLRNIINPIHILLGLNSGSVKIYSSSMMGWESTELNLGLIGLMILPVLAIIISNIIFFMTIIMENTVKVNDVSLLTSNTMVILGVISSLH